MTENNASPLRGFTLVEVMLAVAISAAVAAASLFLLIQTVASFNDSTLTSYLMEQLRGGLNLIERDFRETGSSEAAVHNFTDPKFTATQSAWALASARGADAVFRVNSLYMSDWQGVIVYCAYKAGDIGELRRYVSYVPDGSPYRYRPPFTFLNISEDTIELRDSGGTVIEIDRGSGSVETDPAGRGTAGETALRVVSGSITSARIFEQDGVYEAVLRGSVRGRMGNILLRELTGYISSRGN